MDRSLRIGVDLLRCPATGVRLEWAETGLTTQDHTRSYGVVSGVPVLVAPELTPIDVSEYLLPPVRRSRFARWADVARAVTRAGPSLSLNVRARRNLERIAELLGARPVGARRLLVVGGATAGEGFEVITSRRDFDIVDADLALGPRTTVVCDAHFLPFADGTFDAVITQAVLEHVLDPQRAVNEIYRVLVPDGLVYSEIPFMAQVHEGAHDVTRFTLLGHRRLYRWFTELDSGVATGPGMALLWSVRYFCMAFSTSRFLRAAITRVVTLTLFWLKYFDYYLADKPGGADAALGTYFLGRRSGSPLSDKDILAGYHGAVPNTGATSRA